MEAAIQSWSVFGKDVCSAVNLDFPGFNIISAWSRMKIRPATLKVQNIDRLCLSNT